MLVNYFKDVEFFFPLLLNVGFVTRVLMAFRVLYV